MPPSVATELEILKGLLQRYTGFTFPKGLEVEFGYRIGRGLQKSEFSLAKLIQRLEHLHSSDEALSILSPLLPELLIGETYFWRDPEIFEALTARILPELVSRKETYSKFLRVWSAACSTGEEAYSISILIKRYFQGSDWSTYILGSDINEVALAKARLAQYGGFSFRSENILYPECFEIKGEGGKRQVKEEYRANVRFQKTNLASDEYPSPVTDTTNFDIIFCRNIFIYFAPELIQQIVDRLYECLNEGGYLVVSPCEYSLSYFKRFEAVQIGAVTLYRRPIQPFFRCLDNYQPVVAPRGLSNLPAPVLPPATPAQFPPKPEMEEAGNLLGRARTARANNQNEEAIRLALKAVEQITLLSEGYLLLSDLYYEAGRLEEALVMARKFVYLEPERAEGQYQLALIQKALGKKQRAAHAYRRLLNLLEHYKPQATFELLPGLNCESLKALASKALRELE